MLMKLRSKPAKVVWMKKIVLINAVRLMLTVMLAVTMIFGAAVADIHPVDADEIACQSADITAQHANLENPNLENDDEDQRPIHDHHVHNCGPCHVHMVGMKVAGFSYDTPAVLSLRPGSDQTMPRGGPLGLYRPPRA